MFVTDRVVDASGLAPIYKSGKFDGIFGLGWGVLSVTKAPPPVVLWKQRGLIPRAMFAIRLSKDPHDDGELTIGGYNLTHATGPVTWVPVIKKAWWVSVTV
eukprot:Blabericola_migrator_1__2275@NODE_162_length_12453_cov_160_380914_g139_i1_p8_GENE_NODE_162_length_12453_cov_160_380914_g139_i1NODE_162_length_12453_cov_160_380914_g139_i1_p8_ORF_typecomplete_len101_score10_90Asp/PF00026_23/1_1e18_NODE_162_length_12453_cov_160_380914_g139_i180478349